MVVSNIPAQYSFKTSFVTIMKKRDMSFIQLHFWVARYKTLKWVTCLMCRLKRLLNSIRYKNTDDIRNKHKQSITIASRFRMYSRLTIHVWNFWRNLEEIHYFVRKYEWPLPADVINISVKSWNVRAVNDKMMFCHPGFFIHRG